MEPELRRDLLLLLRAPGFAPLLEGLHAALRRGEAVRGRVAVPSHEAADALEDLTGKRVRPGGFIRAAEVDRLLRENTRFRCSLEEAVALHTGAPIRRPRVERERALQARERAVRRCFALLPELGLPDAAYARVVSWLHAEERGLRAAFTRWGEAELLRAVRATALAFARMPAPGAPPAYLAEIANDAAGDAHALDAGRPASALLLRALAYHFPETARRERRGSAAWRTNLLAEAGIARDPVSTRVDTFGLLGDTPYLRELRRAALSRSVNLDDLTQFGADVRAWRHVVFVVENPTVFSALFRAVRETYPVEKHPTLVCTNGNLNLADRGLLDALCGSGAHVFYAGDFDAPGVQIASVVLERYPGAASPWRMEAADYRDALRDEAAPLDADALQPAGRVFPALVAEMRERRRVAHQESLIARLQADLDRFVIRGETPPRRGEPPSPAVHHPVTA